VDDRRHNNGELKCGECENGRVRRVSVKVRRIRVSQFGESEGTERGGSEMCYLNSTLYASNTSIA